MRIQDLEIPGNLKKRYAQAGIAELYPPQAECVEKGILVGKNTLVAIPTASGKTLIAEMAMHNAINKGGKCLYIVPLKALAQTWRLVLSIRAGSAVLITDPRGKK